MYEECLCRKLLEKMRCFCTIIRKNTKEVINVGDRISVPRTFFDNTNIEIGERYSAFLPKTVMGIFGTVLHVYSGSRINVRWNIDGSVSIMEQW